jgi:hypothetical protein
MAKTPPRRAKLTPRSKVKVTTTKSKPKVTVKAAKNVPLPQTYEEAYALANPGAQVKDLHLNPKTGVYGESPYANLLEARQAAQEANPPKPRTVRDVVNRTKENVKGKDFAGRAQEKMQSWSAQRAQAEREAAIREAEAASQKRIPRVAQVAQEARTPPKPGTVADVAKSAREQSRVQGLAGRAQEKMQSWSAQRAQAEREAAVNELASREEAMTRPKRIAPVESQPKPTTIREKVTNLNRERVVNRGQEKMQSWAAQQAEAERAASMRPPKMSPREATMSSQSRRLATPPPAAAVAEDAAMMAEGQAASRIGGLARGLRGGAITALLELLTNPQEISERSSIRTNDGRTWEQYDNDRAASQHYFDKFADDSQYQAGAADATAVSAPLYKAPEMHTQPIAEQTYTMNVPPATNYGGGIAQQLSGQNPDDAYLEQIRRKKLAEDMAASAPRQSSYSGGKYAPMPLFDNKIAF